MTTDNGGAPTVSISVNNPAGGNPPVNTPPNNSGGGGDPAGGGFAALNEANRTYAEKKGWKDLDAVLGSYQQLEQQFSKTRTNPQGQPDGTQTVVPTSPAEYDLKLPDGFPQNGAYDKNLAEGFKTWAHKAKLTTAQAQALHDQFVSDFAGKAQAASTQAAQQFTERASKTHDALTKEWGSPESPGFKRALEMSRRAMAQLEPGLKDSLKAFGVIQTDAKGQEVVLDASILKALSKAGSRLFAEDELFGAPSPTENPFDPKKPNPTKAGQVMKTNPELARTLIQAAGSEAVADWGWWLNKKK